MDLRNSTHNAVFQHDGEEDWVKESGVTGVLTVSLKSKRDCYLNLKAALPWLRFGTGSIYYLHLLFYT